MDNSIQIQAQFNDRQVRVIAEIQRVAKLLDVTSLSQDTFDKHHELAGLSTAGYQFGSWNRAVQAAGLKPNTSSGGRKPIITDEALLKEVIRLHHKLKKRPSEREMARFGDYSPKPFSDRWGTFAKARDAAYLKYGEPSI